MRDNKPHPVDEMWEKLNKPTRLYYLHCGGFQERGRGKCVICGAPLEPEEPVVLNRGPFVVALETKT